MMSKETSNKKILYFKCRNKRLQCNMTDAENVFDQPINSMIKAYEKYYKKFTIGQGDDYTTGCLLDYTYFKKYKMVAIDLSKTASARCRS